MFRPDGLFLINVHGRVECIKVHTQFIQNTIHSESGVISIMIVHVAELSALEMLYSKTGYFRATTKHSWAQRRGYIFGAECNYRAFLGS